MGLFSRETTISVASVIYPLGEELDKIPDIVKAAVISSGIQGTSRSRAINTSIFDGQGIKLRQGFQYAARSYYAGLPIGFPKVSSAKNDPTVEMLCESYLNDLYSPVAVDVISVAVEYTSNHQTILHQQIETKYNYDFYEEAVHTTVFGLPVDSELTYEALPPDDLLHLNEVGWRLTFVKPDTTVVTFDEWYSTALFATAGNPENRLIMEVSLAGAPAISLSYSQGGSDALLNLFLRSLEVPQSGTFPCIVLKKALGDKKAVYLNDNLFTGSDWATGAAYKTSKVYARRLGLNLDDLLDMVKTNPDQKQIDYAFIQPGTKINSPNMCAHEYHYNYFNRLFLSFGDNKPTYDAWVASASTGNPIVKKNVAKNCPAHSVHLLDPDDTKNTLNVEIAWRYITYEVVSGALSAPYEVVCGAQELTTSRFQKGRGTKTVTYDTTKLYLRKRLTESTYGQLTVVGLWHENYVYKGEIVSSGVWDAFNDPDGDFGSGFILPLEREVLYTLSGREQLQLGQEAMHMVFNCFKVTKEKWYQTGFFKVILAVVSIVVIYLSWGALSAQVSALYYSVWANVGVVLGVGASLTVIAAVAAIITGLIMAAIYVGVSLVAKEAGEWAAEKWGPAWGAIVQIGVTIALSWGAGEFMSSITTISPPPIGLAQSVLNGASFVLSGLSSYTQFAMEELKEASDKWNDYITSPDNPMENVEKLLEQHFPDMGLTQQAMLFAPLERMDNYLERTLSLTDGLMFRLTVPIEGLAAMTLTTRLD